MILPFAFWDASVVVPLCIDQRTSKEVHLLFKRYSLVVWWATATEVQSSFARLFRSGQISLSARQTSVEYLDQLSTSWRVILPSDELAKEAQSLLHTYPLRAADSLQLAAAMIWCRRKPHGRTFVCCDIRLGEAAAHVGFMVLNPETTQNT